MEWKNALLKWTGRVGSDETIKADAEAKGYNQSYRIRPTDPADASKDERNLGDILDGSVASIGDKRDNRQEFLVAAPMTAWYIFSVMVRLAILMT